MGVFRGSFFKPDAVNRRKADVCQQSEALLIDGRAFVFEEINREITFVAALSWTLKAQARKKGFWGLPYVI